MEWFIIIGVVLIVSMGLWALGRHQDTRMGKVQVVADSPRFIPQKSHDSDVGYDLVSSEHVHLLPGQRQLVDVGIRIAVPENMGAFIHPRSGMAHKHGITVLNTPGTLDPGYTGRVKVNLANLGDEAVTIYTHERIAQLVFKKVESPSFTEVDDLLPTVRGNGGHGSTGTGVTK